MSCVVYLHGNASSQREGMFLPPIFISAGVSVLCFDFSGCGCSQGEYISLGFFERDDVACAINFIRANSGVGCVGIWGRSMGAVCAIYALADDLCIAAALVDSPFSSLSELVKELAAREHIPSLVVTPASYMISKKIKVFIISNCVHNWENLQKLCSKMGNVVGE
jgi:alpha/beta superfamily hydrolase